MSELKVVGANKKEFKVEMNKIGDAGLFNGDFFEWDVVKTKGNSYNIIKDNKSYNLEVLSVISEEKSFNIKVDGIKYVFNAKDKYDELLHSLGMDNLASKKIADLKAPMPGLVLDIAVETGQEVIKGDTLLILEAMKMENVIKSEGSGIVKSLAVSADTIVNKGELLVEFE
mgnify:CR=1 FL=1